MHAKLGSQGQGWPQPVRVFVGWADSCSVPDVGWTPTEAEHMHRAESRVVQKQQHPGTDDSSAVLAADIVLDGLGAPELGWVPEESLRSRSY